MLEDLPQINKVLAEVGTLARLYKQRLTFHSSEFLYASNSLLLQV